MLLHIEEMRLRELDLKKNLLPLQRMPSLPLSKLDQLLKLAF